jgi:hypothetical protein
MNGHHPHSQPGSYPGSSPYGQAPQIDMPPGDPKPKRDLFGLLDGFPSNILVVLGLFLLLLGLTIPGCREAFADSKEAEWRLAEALMDHDLTQMRRAQEREREAERQQAATNPAAVVDVSANEARRTAQLTAEEQRLERSHDIPDKRRAALEAAASVRGMWVYRWVEWLGRLLLLLGLIVITAQATGAKQKVFVVLTTIVLLTSISGIDFNFDVGSRVRTSEERESEGALDPPRRIPSE